MPSDFALLGALKEIYLDYNRLEALPPSILRLRGLVLISAQNNSLSAFPATAKVVTLGSFLTHLNLDSNMIDQLPPVSLSETFPYLEFLGLANNRLAADDVRNGLNGFKHLKV